MPNLEQFIKKTYTTRDTIIAYRTAGSGPPLLLLHGYPQTMFMWHLVADRLAEDFTVVMADLRGYGDSGKPPTDSSHDQTACFLQVLRFLLHWLLHSEKQLRA